METYHKSQINMKSPWVIVVCCTAEACVSLGGIVVVIGGVDVVEVLVVLDGIEIDVDVDRDVDVVNNADVDVEDDEVKVDVDDELELEIEVDVLDVVVVESDVVVLLELVDDKSLELDT